MKKIEKYQSDSGREFGDAASAMVADAIFALQNEVSKLLPQAVDDSCTFANGGGYVQHSQSDIDAFKRAMRRLIAMEFGESSQTLKLWDQDPTGFVGRYLDDSNSDTYRLYLRLACIDDQLREWGQGYYRLHPNEGTQTEWKKTARLGIKGKAVQS